VAAPLLVESKVFGVLIAARRKEHSFSSGECEFLKQLSEHVALAAHQAQLYGALQQAYDDLRQSQQAILQQERLRALGQMASGIAHDINNAISPVTLYTESLLATEPSLSTRARDYLTTIQHAMEDVAQTVSRMREFYRKREAQLSLYPINLNRLVSQVVNLTRVRWSDMPQQNGIVIEMHSDLADDLPAVLGVESEIREALTNLIFNAVDAMPDGGILTVRTRIKPRSGNEAAILTRAIVEVIDTGIGMDEDTRRRCLEPFFTTKGERGTGLGLAMVYGTVQRHNAEIEIDSTPGNGTTFRLLFPLPTTSPSEHVVIAPVQTLARLRLLVIDDDPLIIKSLSDILESEGHEVTAVAGGQVGIDAFIEAQNSGVPFALVITDLGMPYVDGRKVAGAIKAVSPRTPIILLTGWGERMTAEGDIPLHVDKVLSKPPKLSELRSAFFQLVSTVSAS
jgi:signal transduction histidine kinase/ActR/RegA family two-component response regulator